MIKKLNVKMLVRHVEIAAMIIATICLIIYLITIVSSSSAFHTEMAARGAVVHFDEDMKQVSASRLWKRAMMSGISFSLTSVRLSSRLKPSACIS